MTGQVRADDPGEPSSGVPRVSVTDEEAAILADMAHGLCVLEIGTGLGVSTRALASTAAHVVTVDVDEWVHATIAPDLPANVTALRATPNPGTYAFGLVFIDGDHTETAVRADVWTASLLAPDAILVAHDAAYPHVRTALGDGWEVIPTTYGLAVRRP